MKRLIKMVAVAAGALLLLLIAWIAANQIPRWRAKPPANVTDVLSCLAWLKEPMGVYRITANGIVYYQITGPAGCYLPSGPSGYTFDSHGRFIGWSPDIGDLKLPREVFADGAEREEIAVDELRRSF